MTFLNHYVKPDEWNIGENLIKSDGFKDSSFPGCEYRLPSCGGDLAVNIRITGRMSHYIGDLGPSYKTRINIEFVGDGTPSVFSGGWIYSKEPIK